MSHSIKPGVATGKKVQAIFKHAKENGYALPAVNVIGSNTINGVLETAAKLNTPVILQFSNGGAQFNAGKGYANDNQQAAVAGAIAGAKHVHELAKRYGATVILRFIALKNFYLGLTVFLMLLKNTIKNMGIPFLALMIDLSEEPIEENIELCKKYLERMSKMEMTLKSNLVSPVVKKMV